MDITKILGQVKRELANSDPWKVTHIEAKQRILETVQGKQYSRNRI